MLLLFILIGGVLLFTALINWKRKKIIQVIPTIHSHAKPEEKSNYSMGNHHYFDGSSHSNGDL